MEANEARSWLRCYRCWSTDLEVQVHYEGIHKIDPETGERAEAVDELQEAVVQCLECMHDQPHLGFHNGRVEPIEDRWERMIAGTPWVASCTVTVDADDVETCSGPEAGDALSYAAFGDHGTREFFTHVRFHKHDGEKIVVHLLVELYARSPEEATQVLEEAARGHQVIRVFSGEAYERRRFEARSESLRGFSQRMTVAAAATVPNHLVAPPRSRIRPRSMVSIQPSATMSAAATGSVVGKPNSRAWSLPVPAGTMPSGIVVSASTCSASAITPSPPTTTSASVPLSTSFWNSLMVSWCALTPMESA